MATRSDQKFRYGTREDILRRGTGIGGEVAVSHGKLELRELEIALNTVGDTGGQNLKQTVDDIVSLVRGPLSRYILEMGRFINDQGEVSRLAQVLMDDLETSGTSDSDAIHDNVASEISAITEKASPVGADLLVIEDSAAGNVKKRLQITNLPAGGEVNDLSASVTWANIPDANVPASAVTQHEGAIDHDALTNFAAGEHRIINDAGTSATELWSASKVNTEVGAKIGASGVTYGNLDANADVGTGATQVAQGDHTHGQLHDAVTLAGTPDYITLSGQVLTRNDVDLANDITGNLPVGNLNSGTGATSSTFWRGDGTWAAPTASADLKPYCVTGSGVNLTTTEATMDLSTEQVADANYSLATDQITVTDAGTYQISYGVQVLEDGTGGAARSATTFHMEIGTTPITQSEMSCYNRETSGPSGASTTFIVVLSASDVLQLRGFVDYTSTTDVSQGVTSVSIIKLE